MNKKMFSLLTAITLGFTVFVGCSTEKVESNEPITLIAAHVNTNDSSFHVGMEAFKERLEELSAGRLKVEIHANGELGGNENELVEKIATGTVDVVVAAPNFIASVVPAADLFSIPYLYEDDEHWKKVVTGDVGKSITEKIEDGTDFKVLGYWQCGTRVYFGSKPVVTIGDLSGVKIRVHNSDTIQSVWTTLGAQPTSLAYNELYSGLQNNVIDAAENDLGNILLQKFYEAGPYISLTNHDIATRLFIMGGKKFDSLSEQEKEWVSEAGRLSQADQWKYDTELQVRAMKEIEANGGIFNEVNTEEFAEKTYQVRLDSAKKIGVEKEFITISELKK